MNALRDRRPPPIARCHGCGSWIVTERPCPVCGHEVTNAQRGTAFENRTRKYLEENGYWVIRSARSLGEADLVAVKPGQMLLVQCKISGRGEPIRLDRLTAPRAARQHARTCSEPFEIDEVGNHEQ